MSHEKKPEKPMVGYSIPQEIKGLFLGKPDPALQNAMEKFGSIPKNNNKINGQQPNAIPQKPNPIPQNTKPDISKILPFKK